MHTRRIQAIVVTLLSLAIVFLRHPGQFLHPQFWIEGSYLYGYSLVEPKLQFLFQGTTGYLLFPQRIIVLLIPSTLPPIFHPAFCVALSMLLFLLIVFHFSMAGSRLPLFPLFAVAVVLSPHYGSEVYAKLLYLMWILPLVYVFVLFRDCRESSLRTTLIDLFLIVLAGLSGPLVFLFVVPLAYVFLMKRNWYFALMLFGTLCGVGVQLLYLVQYPASAVAQSSDGSILKTSFVALLSNYIPQYFVPAWIPQPEVGMFLLVTFGILAVSLDKKFRLETSILAVLFFCTAVPPLLKLYPNARDFLNPVTSNSSRYFFFPYIAITLFLLLVALKGKLWGRLAASFALVFAFFNHLPGFQIRSLDYRWAEHIQAAEKRKCRVRVPIPFIGREGSAWIYQPQSAFSEICSDVELDDWQGGASERVVVKEDGTRTFNTSGRTGVISTPSIPVTRHANFISFSAMVDPKPRTFPEFGMKFYDSKNKMIKNVRDMIYHPLLACSVAVIPEHAAYVRPYVRLKQNSPLELSAPSILMFPSAAPAA